MKKKELSFLAFGVFTLLFLNVCWAAEPAEQSKEYEVYNLGEIVVAADKVKEVAIKDEITAEDIQATNSKTVAEALFNAPGVRVTTGAKNAPNVSIHGFAQSRILILIDGVPYYETKYATLDLNQIPTENIAKIEIIKGAASVLYGANALGGVINIITKTPTEKPYTSASAEFGENDTQRFSATHGMKKGILNYWLNYTYATSDGYDLSDDFEPKPTEIIKKPGGTTEEILQPKGERVNSDYDSNDLWAKIGVEPQQDSQYYLNFHYLDRDKAWAPSTDTLMYFNSRPYFTQFARLPDYIDWGLDFDAKQKVHDKVTLKSKLFYHDHSDDLVSYSDKTYTTALATSNYKDYIVGGSFFTDVQADDSDTIRFSIHYKKDNHQQRDDTYLPYEESESYTGSLGVENEWTIIKNLTAVAGASHDWFDVTKAEKTITDKNTGDFIEMDENPTPGTTAEFNPMGGLTYTFSDATQLFASAANKSRFPTLNELYSTKGGNPDLKSETSWNYTIGASRPIFTFAKAGLSLFDYEVSNLITRDAPNWIGKNVNYAEVRLSGVEVNAEVYPIDRLSLGVDYTYEDARNRSDGRVSDDVTFIPEHKLDFGIQYLVPQVDTRLNFNTVYVGETYSQLPTPASPDLETLKTSDYTIYNAKITQPFLNYFETYVAVDNIFDKNYEPEFGYPAPGRSFNCGIMGKF